MLCPTGGWLNDLLAHSRHNIPNFNIALSLKKKKILILVISTVKVIYILYCKVTTEELSENVLIYFIISWRHKLMKCNQ